MEEDVREFLKRIVWTVGLVFFSFTFTLGIGGYNHLLVPEPNLTIGNIIFYIWFAIVMGVMIYLLVKIWSKKFPHG